MNPGLESFLKEVRKHVHTKELSFFAVGGRGYYENPASDLLRFFLQPDAEHGLGDLFLATFFECMRDNHRELGTKKSVRVLPQVQTTKGNYIDLEITGTGWCLLIENKINHWDANPFTDYEGHAKGLGKQTTLFSILSRDGHDKENNGTKWVGVSYQDYCRALQEKMGKAFFASPFSKWQLFAREFILHLENELYDPPMKDEQVAFVEAHADQLAGAERLARQYREFLPQELKRHLERALAGKTFSFRPVPWPGHVFAFQCTPPEWPGHELNLHKPEGDDGKFHARVYLKNLSEQQLSSALQGFNLGSPVIEGPYYRWTSAGCDSRKHAIEELCRLARIVDALVNTPNSNPTP